MTSVSQAQRAPTTVNETMAALLENSVRNARKLRSKFVDGLSLGPLTPSAEAGEKLRRSLESLLERHHDEAV